MGSPSPTAAEAVVGFYTKFGDGACDLTPLAGLPKRRVRELAAQRYAVGLGSAFTGTGFSLLESAPSAAAELVMMLNFSGADESSARHTRNAASHVAESYDANAALCHEEPPFEPRV